jgi:hypothetical protein
LLGNPAGLDNLDLSDRGMLRSFYSVLWCLPAMLVSWIWWRKAYLALEPASANTGLPFFLRLALVEAVCWMLPLVLLGILMASFGARERYPAIVTINNWLSLPFYYAYAVLMLAGLFVPALQGLIGVLWLVLLLVLVITFSRITKMVLGGQQPLLVTATVMTILIPGMLLSEMLQRFLGIYPG